MDKCTPNMFDGQNWSCRNIPMCSQFSFFFQMHFISSFIYHPPVIRIRYLEVKRCPSPWEIPSLWNRQMQHSSFFPFIYFQQFTLRVWWIFLRIDQDFLMNDTLFPLVPYVLFVFRVEALAPLQPSLIAADFQTSWKDKQEIQFLNA